MGVSLVGASKGGVPKNLVYCNDEPKLKSLQPEKWRCLEDVGCHYPPPFGALRLFLG